MTVPIELTSRFTLIEVLREDTDGSVLVVQDRDGQRSTLKRVHAAGPTDSETLETEFALFQGIRHPHLTQVKEFGRDAEGVWLRREFISGPTLAEAGPDLDEPQRARILRDLLSALGHLHSIGILHLDVKPENILLRSTGSGYRGVLTDFGFASRGATAPSDETGEYPESGAWTSRGTPPFVAPEVLLSLPRDGRADLFSLGVAWLVSGPARVRVDPRTLYPRFPGAPFVEVMNVDLETVDPGFAMFLGRVLETDPHDRPTTAAEAMLALAALPGQEEELPGQEKELPGQEEELPGQEKELPGQEEESPGQEEEDPQDWAALLRPPPPFIGEAFSALEEILCGDVPTRTILATVSYESDLKHLLGRMRFVVAQAAIPIEPVGVGDEETALGDAQPEIGGNRKDRVFARATALLSGSADAAGRSMSSAPRIVAVLDELDAEALEVVVAVARRLESEESDRRLVVVGTASRAQERDCAGLMGRSEVLQLPGLGVVDVADHLRALEGVAKESVANERIEALASGLVETVGVDPDEIERALRRELESGNILIDRGRFSFAGVDPARLQKAPSLEEEVSGLTSAEREVLCAIELACGRLSRRTARDALTPAGLASLSGLVASRRAEISDSGMIRSRRRALSRRVFDGMTIANRRELAIRLLATPRHAAKEERGRVDLERARLLALAGMADRALEALGNEGLLPRAPRGESLPVLMEDIASAMEGDEEAHWKCLLRLARSYVLAGELQNAIETHDRVLESRVLTASDRAEVLCRLGSTCLMSGDSERALNRFEQARRLMGRPAVVVSSALRFELNRGIAFARFQKGDPEGALRSLEGVLRASKSEDRSTPTLRSIAGSFALRAGKPKRARDLLESALREARDLGDDELVAIVQTNRSTLLLREGRFDHAIHALSEALAIRSDRGHRMEEALVLNNLGIARREAGELDASAEALEESARLRGLIGDDAGEASARANLGVVEHLRGNLRAADLHLGWADRTFTESGAVIERVLAACWRSVALLDGGLTDAATKALEGLPVPEAPRAAGELALARARLALEEGRLEDAIREAVRSADRFGAANDLPGGARASLVSARAWTAGGDGGGADRALRAAKKHASPIRLPEILLEEGCALSKRGLFEEALPMLLRSRDEARRLGLTIVRIRAITALAALLGRQPGHEEEVRVIVSELAPAIRGVTWPEESGPAKSGVARAERAFGKEVASLLTMSDREVSTRTGDSARVTTQGVSEEVFRAFVAINRSVLNEDGLDRLLSRVLEHAVVLSGARRGFIALLREGNVVLEARSGELNPESEEISRTIVLDSVRQRRPLLTANASADERLSGRRSIEELDLRSVLCVPFDAGKGIEGAIYVDNPIREGVFSPRSVELLDALAGQAAIAIGNLERIKEIGLLNDRLQERVEESERELHLARRELQQSGGSAPSTAIVAVAESMKSVIRLGERVAKSDLPVLVLGESGSGKEVLARLVHRNSLRSDGPFIAENCSAIPETLLESEFFGHVKGAFTGADRDREGLFQEADGGTLFLDEIGDMPASLQAKLLRVLQEKAVRPVGSASIRPVDIRLVCATHRDLQAMVEDGTFREDLYYRIRGAVLNLPPLRERPDDVPALAERFLERLNEKHDTQKIISPALRRRLMKHDWPGNVRELESEVTRLYHLAEGTELESESVDLPQAAGKTRAASDLSVTVVKPIGEIERDAIRLALRETGGNREEAARRLQISRAAFYVKIKKYDLAEEAPPSRKRKPRDPSGD